MSKNKQQGYDWNAKRDALVARINRAEGQLRGIRGLIERDEPCEKIAQQLAAARAALDKVYFEMMACAIERRLSEAPEGDAQRNELRELTATLAKYA